MDENIEKLVASFEPIDDQFMVDCLVTFANYHKLSDEEFEFQQRICHEARGGLQCIQSVDLRHNRINHFQRIHGPVYNG